MDDKHGIVFESSSLAFQAAIEGMGVAMGQLQLVTEDLAAGRLLMPFDIVVADIDSFYLLYSESAARNKAFQKFRHWLLDEARIDAARIEKVKKMDMPKRTGGFALAAARH